MADPFSWITGISLIAGLIGSSGVLNGGGGAPAPTAPAAPQGTPATNKPKAPPSFISGAAAPTQQQTAQKSLLGQ